MTATIPASSAAGPWTPRVTLGLAVLAAAGFIYVTAEIMPVGALPAIAGDLGVSEAMVATLLASYALVAALSTVPLVRWTAHWPRAADAASDPDLPDRLPADFGAGADFRGAGRRPGALRAHARVDVVGGRPDRRPVGAGHPCRPGHHRGLCRDGFRARGRQSADRRAEPDVGLAAGGGGHHGGRRRRPGGRPVHPAADGDDGGRPDRRRAPAMASPEPPAGHHVRAHPGRGHRALHLVRLHRRHHQRHRRHQRAEPGLAAGRLRRLRSAGDGTAGQAGATAAPRPRSWPAWPG